MDVAAANYKHQEMLVATTSDPLCPTELSSPIINTRTMLGIHTMDGALIWEKNITSNIQYLNCSLIDDIRLWVDLFLIDFWAKW